MAGTVLRPDASTLPGRPRAAVPTWTVVSAASTSEARISPPGPEPRIVAMSTPSSLASRRALGEILAARGRRRRRTVLCLPGRRLIFARRCARVHSRPRRWRRRVALRRRRFTGSDDPRDNLPDGNIGSGRRFNPGKNSVGGSFDFHDCFVGFDFEERLALRDAVALLLPPGKELAGFLRHLESGHYNAEGHSR